jgi:hypothetical protein
MDSTVPDQSCRLSDDDLLRRLAELAGEERRTTAELLAHRAELERRKLDWPPTAEEASQLRPVTALAPGECQIEVAITAETWAHLCRLRGLLRYEVPDGDVATIIDLALSVLLDG